MENILKKDYAKFMEETLSSMVELPVEGICVITKLKGGGFYANYFNSNINDKIIYAGIIQQDATLDMLKANKLIRENDSEE